MRFFTWLLKEIGSGIVTAVVAALVLVLAGPLFLQSVADSIPTCQQPAGLKRIVFTEPVAPVFDDGLDVTQDEPAPPATRTSRAVLGEGSEVTGSSATYITTRKEDKKMIKEDSSTIFAPQQAFDQSVASSWAVLRADVDAGINNGLTLTVGGDHDVVLICATNGAALSDFGYNRADRVHEMEVKVTCSKEESSRVVYLRSMPAERIQEGQDLNIKCRAMSSLAFTIKSTYIGQEVTNSEGKSERATKRVALSDVALYELGADSTLGQRIAASV